MVCASEMTMNQISTTLTNELAKQVKIYKGHTDKIDMIISDAISNTSKKLQVNPSYIISLFGISRIRKMLPIGLYREIGYTN